MQMSFFRGHRRLFVAALAATIAAGTLGLATATSAGAAKSRGFGRHHRCRGVPARPEHDHARGQRACGPA